VRLLHMVRFFALVRPGSPWTDQRPGGRGKLGIRGGPSRRASGSPLGRGGYRWSPGVTIEESTEIKRLRRDNAGR